MRCFKFSNSQRHVEIRLAATEVNFCSMLTSPNLLTSRKSVYRKYKPNCRMVVSLAGNYCLLFYFSLYTLLICYMCILHFYVIITNQVMLLALLPFYSSASEVTTLWRLELYKSVYYYYYQLHILVYLVVS